MSLVASIGQLLRIKHAKNFEKATRDPQKYQWIKLKEIISKNSDTSFGWKYKFDQINSFADFQKNVPISKFSDLEPYLDRIVKGEKNILTVEEPLYYCMTSGSTGKPKMTPITKSYKNDYQSVVHTFLYYTYKDHPKAFSGKVLYFNGSAEIGRTNQGIAYGTMSGYNFRNLPKVAQKLYAIPYEITVIEDLFSRYYCLVLLSLHQDITMMVGITAAPIITFLKSFKNNITDMIQDLKTGKLNEKLKLTESERKIILDIHNEKPKLAKKLNDILEKNQKISVKDIWPNIDLIICWKSSTAGGYLDELNKLLEEKVTIRDAIYSATEGWCNVPYTDNKIGGPLAITAHVYEFIEENDQFDTVLQVHQLEIGKKYRILYTTSGGIYRYDIGDIMEVTELFNNTPCAKFIRKVGRTANIVGEKMTENHLNQAMLKALNENKLISPFYVFLPNQDSFPPNYKLLIELNNDSDKLKIKDLIESLEKYLCKENWEYESHRLAGDLKEISFEFLENNSMDTFRKQQIRLGADEAQIKPLILAQNMDRISDLKIIKRK